jgi:hypothetical protein
LIIGRSSVSGESVQLAVGVHSPTVALYSMPTWKRGVIRLAALNLQRGRGAFVSTQRIENCHSRSKFPEPRNRPSPGHPVHVGTATRGRFSS